MLDLRNSKCYKIGEKNLVTRDNDFEMATGNVNGIMGYDSRIRIKGTNKVDSTKNGKGDLAVMSIETYEELTSRFELYSQIKEGMDDIATGNTRPFSEAMADIRSRRNR